MTTLDILVPQYEESTDVIKPLLDSVALQQTINFDDIQVIVCHDGSWGKQKKLHTEWQEFVDNHSYPFKMILINTPKKRGVSDARQHALDHSRADLVMFCDIDDMFFNNIGLYTIFQGYEHAPMGFDTLVSAFMEESHHPETKEVLYIPHETDSTFVHGKVHRRGYLIEQGIKWNSNLTVHEDSYFNCLCQHCTDKVLYTPVPFYLWKWRDESVCRHDPDYILKTYNNMLDSNDALIDQFNERRKPDKARFFAGMMILDAYYTMNKKDWIEKTNKHYRDAVEKRFARYFRKHLPEWNKLSEQEKMQISNGVRTRSVMEGMPMESITLEQWLEHIQTIS